MQGDITSVLNTLIALRDTSVQKDFLDITFKNDQFKF